MAEKNTTTETKGIAEIDKRIDPLYIVIDGTDYELDFNRESLQFMARNQFRFDPAEIIDFLPIKGPELWYYALRAHHKKLSRQQTDALYEALKGLTAKIIERLFMLYNQALMSNSIIQDDEDLEKNPRVQVKF